MERSTSSNMTTHLIHRNTGRLRPWLRVALGAALLTGCTELPADDAPLDTSDTSQDAIVLLGNIYQNGTLVSFDEVTAVTGLALANVVGLTACDRSALYAVEQQSSGPPFYITSYALWFSNSGGQAWTKQSALGKGPELACDHAQLATLDSSKRLWVAPLQANGTVGAWAQAPTSVQVDRIQGGDGTIYGVKVVASGKDVYVASNKAAAAPLAWTGPIANVGAVQVTGTGATATGSDSAAVGNSLAWSRRAFALEANGTVSTNSGLLAGSNGWAWLDTGSERYTTLTAAGPDLLYGIQVKAGVKHLGRIRIEETSCFDGVDNDADGLRDGEDPACTVPVASNYCATHATGNYCADRFQPATFLDQANQNAALIHCAGGVATSVTPGVCVRNPAFSNADSLASLAALTPAEPAGTGHYCNVHWPDGTWGFNWLGATPCVTLLASKPGGTIVRAGLYSTTGVNHVFAACSNGWVGPAGSVGVAPLQAVDAAVGHTTNRCILSVSMASLPVFDRMFSAAHELPLPRTTNPFVHNQASVSLAQFGNGQSGTSAGVDRFGLDVGAREAAYDHPIDEGRPLYAVSGGVVITNGSRVRDVSIFGCGGTPNQGELYVKYAVGTDPTYQESFVVYYAHVRKRLVVDGQTVKAGQILGYVGASGCTGGYAHLHSGVMRLSNTNAHTAAAPEAGYHVAFAANGDPTGTNTGGLNSIDPLGWANGNAFDPWGYNEWAAATSYGFTGKGAWSIALFKPGQTFHYP
ncbi:MAG: peptidoglycan DD-metalloendopeptidase family protein [Kofleriaceae bacterium]